MQIYPYPYSMKQSGEMFEFGTSVSVRTYADAPRELLQILWSNFTLGKSSLQFEEAGSVDAYFLCIGTKKPIEMKESSSYSLSADKTGVSLVASDKTGFMQGFMSLLQLLCPQNLTEGNVVFTVQGCRIDDKPRLGFRGIHLCLFPGMELSMLQKILRLCAFMKYSHVILEFWGSLRFSCLPELGWQNAFTKEEIRPVLEEAKALGLELIPMFNHFGHASQARARYGKHVVLDQNPDRAMLFGPDGWTWNIANPEAVQMLKNIREELFELFGEGEYFHLGFDEAFVYEEELSPEERNELLLTYMNGLCEEICQKGRRPMIWGDMFLEHTRWKNLPPPKGRYSATGFDEHKILPRLDKRFLITDWQYYITEGEVETNKFFMEQGFEVIPCPWNNYDNVNLSVNMAKTYEMPGMLQTTWDNLQEDIIIIPYAGTAMWEKENRKYSVEELGVIRVKAMHFIRKLMPSGGQYAKAGWKAFEI